MADETLGAIGAGIGRGARAFRDYRRIQYADLAEQRRSQEAKRKADDEAAEKLADETAQKRLAEIRTQLNNIRAQAGIYETDELGNTVIREDIFNERLAPLLEEAASVKSKSHDGADWADFYYKVNIAHRLPQPKKPSSPSAMSDLEGHIQAAMEAEAFQLGRDSIEDLSPIEREQVRKRATKEFTEITDKSEGRTPKTLEEKTLEYAEKLYQQNAMRKDYTPEMALAEAQKFYGAAKQFMENPDVPIVPPAPAETTKAPVKKEEGGGSSLLEFLSKLGFGALPGTGKEVGAKQKKAAQPGVSAQPDSVEVDINDPSLMEDRSDINERGIDVNAKAEDDTDPSFEFFEDAEDYYKNRFAQSADSLQKALSAAGRLLPKRKKK